MYDNKFYDKYLKQLEEPLVRQTHDKMFYVGEFEGLNVVDLGCGTAEFDRYHECHTGYAGFDLEDMSQFIKPPGQFQRYNFVTDIDKILNTEFGDYYNQLPHCFISLFATEIHLSVEDRYELYRKIFNDAPHIESGMVSGFYYVDRYNKECIVEEIAEVGTFNKVYQTVEQQKDYIFSEFTEYRTYQHVPSKMFGDLVEVWKFLVRNK